MSNNATKSQSEKASAPAPKAHAGPAQTTDAQSLAFAPALQNAADALTLQRAFGNQRTSRLIQAKLTVGAANDPLEREADRVAEQVVSHAAIQRNPEEDELQAMRIQRTPQEEDELMTKRDDMLDSFDAGGDFESKLSASGSGAPLDGNTRAQMEAGIGADFGNVRVHTGDHASLLNRSISARAFTRGSDVFFDRGQYNPGSVAGKRLLAHELTHVVQQGGASQSPVQRWPWSKKNKTKSTGNDNTTPTSNEGTAVNDNTEASTDNATTDDNALTIDADYSNSAVENQASTRFKYTVLVWQQNKNYLDFQKIRAWSMMRNRLRDMFRATGVGKLFVRKGKTSKEVKEKTARSIASQQEGYGDMDQQQQLRAVNDAMSHSNDLGHTWSRLTAYAGDEVKDIYSFGFWPAQGIGRPDEATQGDVMHPDQVHDSDAPLRVMHYDIPAKNYQAALKWADGQVQNPPQYKMIGLNCTSWSRMLGSKAGVSLPSSANVFPAEPAQGFFQSIHSPNRLYDTLGEQKDVNDNVDAVPKAKSPYSFMMNFSFGSNQDNEESSDESYDLPEARSVHKLNGPLTVKTSRGKRTIDTGTDIMVTEAGSDDEIRVESAAVRGDFNSVIRGFTDVKSFWTAVNGPSTTTPSNVGTTPNVPNEPQHITDIIDVNHIGTLRASNDDIKYVVDMGIVDADVLRGLNDELLEELADAIDLTVENLRKQIDELPE